ncbi:MAG: hypothetical protein H7287_07175 [Thermoleophilia bacterium]|nr:hypothetical protein [Thermoleophilia bacterium]
MSNLNAIGATAIGLGSAAALGGIAYGATIKTTNVGDWAHPVKYTNAASSTSAAIGIGAAVIGTAGAFKAAQGIGLVSAFSKETKSYAAANIAKFENAAEGAAAKAKFSAAMEAVTSGKAGTRIGIGIAAAMGGVAMLAGLYGGLMKTHERMEKPNLTIKIEGETHVIMNPLDTVGDVGKQAGNLFNDIFNGGKKG